MAKPLSKPVNKPINKPVNKPFNTSRSKSQVPQARPATPIVPRTPKLGAIPGGAAPERDTDTFTPELDRLIHERLRLGIVSALAVNDTLSFNELKELMHTTDGNLSVHARKLEDAEYVSCTKTFEGRVPHTQYSLTPLGRKALTRYLDHMEALIRTTRER